MSENKPNYQKLDPITHILLRPETYIGSINTEEKDMYVVEDVELNNIKIVQKNIKYVPAFIKLFDEIIVNASDQAIRTGKVKLIKVNIDNEKIEVENDGPSIPIEIHEKENIYIPELIFASLYSGQNFDDTEERVVGGRNGLGSKLTNVFSTKFIIDTCDGKKKYKQIVKNNMREIGTPTIKDVSSNDKSYTSIIYYPELSRFNLTKIDNDSKALMMKRCLDIAVYNPKVRVVVNGKTLPIKSVKDYMKMHLSEDTELFYEKMDNGWDVGIAKSPTEQFEQVSIVNGISTYKGGTHVNYVSLQVSKDVADSFSKKVKANWVDVKNKMMLFLISQVPNPEFDSQTKENLTKYISKEISKGSQVSQSTIKKIMKSEIVESILAEIEAKELRELNRLQKNLKSTKVEKLIDAKGKNRNDCVLGIFEGLASISGVRDKRNKELFGAYPLRGKFINVSELSPAVVVQDVEVQGLISSIGLQIGEKVKEENLRYGKIFIYTDADFDGDSIASQLINFFYKYWKELFEQGRIYKVQTPLLVAEKGKVKKYFYLQSEYDEWEKTVDVKSWNIEYKKGLASLVEDEYDMIINEPRLIQLTLDKASKESLEVWFGSDTNKRKDKLMS